MFQNHQFKILLLVIIFLLAWIINIGVGSVHIPFVEILKLLTFQSINSETYTIIILEWRIPKAITAISVGAGLSAVGMVMQTLFRNPMADASVLGISSGAGLGVAVFLLTPLGFSYHFLETSGIIFSAVLGAFLVLVFIVFMTYKLHNMFSVLIIGLMFNALTTAIISVLSIFAPAQNLQRYYFWGMGSLGHLHTIEIVILVITIAVCLLVWIGYLKPLNAMLFGNYLPQTLGFDIKKINNQLLIISSIIIGVITAFTGPIAFIGLAVPHIARLWLKTSNHKILFPVIVLLGSIVLLLCDTISQIVTTQQVIPINAITSVLGAPLVIYLIISRKSYRF